MCFHAGATREIQFPPYVGFSPEVAAAMEAITRPVSTVLVVANFLYSRILERFPRLKVVFAETSLAWGAYELELADHQFERQRLHNEGYEHLAVGALQAAMSSGRVVRFDGAEDPPAHRASTIFSGARTFPRPRPPGRKAARRSRAVSTVSPTTSAARCWSTTPRELYNLSTATGWRVHREEILEPDLPDHRSASSSVGAPGQSLSHRRLPGRRANRPRHQGLGVRRMRGVLPQDRPRPDGAGGRRSNSPTASPRWRRAGPTAAR